MRTFRPLFVTTKFFNYSLPLNLDTYRRCSFQCEYCFMKNRVIGKRDENIKANVNWLKKQFKKVYDDKDINKENFLEILLKNRITINGGTKSDPFQPREKTEQTTRDIVELCNQYDQKIIFTTKTDNYYGVNVTPQNHSFNLSISNHYNDAYLEPNVPSFEKRVEFYHKLKDEGFKVGIRFEPFIPNITDIQKCLSYFEDVDHVHVSRIRLIPQIDNTELLTYMGCSKKDFTGFNSIRFGLHSLKAEVWYEYVKDSLNFLEENGYSYSTSFIHIGNGDGLGGDALGWKTTGWDTYHLKEKYGDNWTLDEGLNEMGEYKYCDCRSQFTSNRHYGCKTVEDFYRHRWDKPSTKFTPQNQFKPPSTTLLDF